MTTAVSGTYLPLTNSPVLRVRSMLFEPHWQSCSLPRTGSRRFSAQLSVTTSQSVSASTRKHSGCH